MHREITITLLTCEFCVPFCAPPAFPSVLVHQFLLPLRNGAPVHFVPARSLDFHVLGGTLSAHPSEPQTSSNGPRRNSNGKSSQLSITYQIKG